MPVTEKGTMLKLSAREHIDVALSAAGWSDTGKWVKLGRIQPETRPPAVAVDCPEVHRITYESGGSERAIRGYFDIGVLGANETQLNDLKDDIAKSLGDMRIVDFSIAMPGDPGYDAAAQTVAYGHIRNIRGRVVDPIEFSARVSFTLETDKPI